MNTQVVKPIALRLVLSPDPKSALEEIEDLIASSLWRHGWRGRVESDATGNTVTLKFLPQADDGRGYQHRGAKQGGAVTIDELGYALRRVMAYLSIHDDQYYEGNADGLRARELLKRLQDAGAPDGLHKFTFAYRDGELTATVYAKSSDEAWQKLERHIGGIASPDVTISVGSARLHSYDWEEMTEESDDIENDGDSESWDEPTPMDTIVDDTDDWPGYATADSVEI